jgi:hypothetical protein
MFIFKKENDVNKRKSNIILSSVIEPNNEFSVNSHNTNPTAQERLSETNKHIFAIAEKNIAFIEEKIEVKSFDLGDHFKITRGFRPPADELVLKQTELAKLPVNEKKDYKKLIIAKDIVAPYALDWGNIYVKYDKDKIPEAKSCDTFDAPKIMLPDISYSPKAYYDSDAYYCLKTIYIILKNNNMPYNLMYITGIINSKMMEFFFRSRFSSMHMQGGYLRFRKQFIERLPICQIDFDNPTQKAMHDKLVSLVEKMLKFNKKLSPIRDVFSHEKDELVKEIEKIDKEIDNLVYTLYDLTEEEIKIIEGS